MDVEIGDIARLIDQADREIAEQLLAARIMIIEDEPLIAANLQILVEGLGHHVTGIARTHDEAVELAENEPPNLILSDIQLDDGSSGVDAVNEILASFEVPVIFITGHPELLLTGTGRSPPFSSRSRSIPKTIRAIISQALFFDVKTHRSKQAKPANDE